MDHASRIASRLHEEHLASLALLGRLEEALAARQPPAPDDRAWGELVRAVCAAFDDEVAHHFDFEERELFPRLAAAGEPGIGMLLAEEHRTIRAVAADLLPALRASIAGAPVDWKELRNAGFGFAERLQGHIQKEEMGLLPMIEDLIDAQTDEALAMAYAA
jgi:hemerythrin-like domain-containing protein